MNHNYKYLLTWGVSIIRFDLHIHSKYSNDSVLDLKNIVKIAKKRGLSGIAITDHNTIKGGLKAKEYETKDFKIIVGSEIKTPKGEILGLFLTNEVDQGDFFDVITDIKNQDGIAVIPHPYDKLRGSAFHPKKEDLKFIDGLEIFNSRCLFDDFNKKALNTVNENSLLFTAGSDSHFANEIGNAGIITETRDVKKALIKKKCSVFGKKSLLFNIFFTKGMKNGKKKDMADNIICNFGLFIITYFYRF